jgi:nickel-dependent lactate racemase
VIDEAWRGNTWRGEASMTNVVAIPWGAWYGDALHALHFPEGWRVEVYPMRDAFDIGAEGIAGALAQPIGTAPLAEVAAARRSAAIVVDDLSRPTPADRVLPPLLCLLEEAGVPSPEIRIIVGSGAHRTLVRHDLVKKLGRDVVERYEVLNHNPYENLEDLGVSSRGTPIRVNRFFLDGDLRIGVGCITPHGSAGFGGGAKIIMPGVSGVEALAWNHGRGGLAGGLGDPDGSEQRADMEEIVERVGLDFVVDVVTTARRGIAGVFAGDAVAAHRAGVAFARGVYATPLPQELVDIAVCNAYPKDTEFLQAYTALTILESARRTGNRILRPGGTTVITTACSEGRGFHALYGAGGRLAEARREPLPFDRMHSAGPIYYSPNLNPMDTNGLPMRADWDALIAQLLTIHGHTATVALFPTGSLQLSG